MVDRFPEAFERFEIEVGIDSFDSYRELTYGFSWWAGKRWVDSYAQNIALKRMAEKRGFKAELPMYFKREGITVRRRKWKRKITISKVKRSTMLYISHGYSANKIQRILKNKGIGIRRKTLLRYIREAKGISVKANREKYIPKKYRR